MVAILPSRSLLSLVLLVCFAFDQPYSDLIDWRDRLYDRRQGLKTLISLDFWARLKPCPDESTYELA